MIKKIHSSVKLIFSFIEEKKTSYSSPNTNMKFRKMLKEAKTVKKVNHLNRRLWIVGFLFFTGNTPINFRQRMGIWKHASKVVFSRIFRHWCPLMNVIIFKKSWNSVNWTYFLFLIISVYLNKNYLYQRKTFPKSILISTLNMIICLFWYFFHLPPHSADL